MHGRDLGVHPEDFVEPPEVEQEAKQEILENKDVRITGSCGAASIVLPSLSCSSCVVVKCFIRWYLMIVGCNRPSVLQLLLVMEILICKS